MSSDIFSRKININQFDLIYAGAQKNMGPAGTTLVIVKNEILGKTGRDIPKMLDYQTHINKESMFNTPPVFAVYVSMLTLEWLQKRGGIAAIEKKHNQKAKELIRDKENTMVLLDEINIALRYNYIDKNNFEISARKI